MFSFLFAYRNREVKRQQKILKQCILKSILLSVACQCGTIYVYFCILKL